MSKLLDLFQAIKEENLDKPQLEDYHKELSELYAMMHIELGDIKKKKGMYMLPNPELSGVAITRKWNATTDGQREIELKSYIKATATTLSSLKSRLFSIY